MSKIRNQITYIYKNSRFKNEQYNKWVFKTN